jgi:hypothetical protein
MNAITPTAAITDTIDERFAFLARAAARHALVEAGAMDIDEAFDGLVADLRCDCDRDIIQRWERLDRARRIHFKKRDFQNDYR